MYGCETCILTETLIEKLDIFVRTFCGNMLVIKQSRDNVTNQRMYQLNGQVPLRKTIRERQLKFTGTLTPQPICHL